MAPIEQSSAQPARPSRRAGSAPPVDVALGASALPLALATAVARRTGSVVRPAVRLAVRPPGVPRRLQPERFLSFLAARGASRRASLEARLSGELDAGVPWALEQMLRRIRLTDVVLDHVDLDAVVVGVDVEAVLDRVDLTAVVLQRVDLDALVNAVISHVDLIGLAEEVIDGVDLPEIIRESTGSMASDAVRGARMQGIAADEAVGRAVDRLLLRRKNRHPAHVLGAQTGHESGLSAPPPQRDGTP